MHFNINVETVEWLICLAIVVAGIYYKLVKANNGSIGKTNHEL